MATIQAETPSQSDVSGQYAEAVRLERQAQGLKNNGDIHQAFQFFEQAAMKYRDLGEHLKSALCFAAAATCWDIHTGWQPLQHSATCNAQAAHEAAKAGHHDYAKTLYHNAALLYEKEGDYEHYSQSYLDTQREGRRRSWEIAFTGREHSLMELAGVPMTIRIRIAHFLKALGSLFSDLFWGYGEKPFRTLAAGAMVILVCAVIYAQSGQVVSTQGDPIVSFLDAFYFSVITFATVGYGDYLPSGGMRFVAVVEALSGIMIAPLFLVSLTRRFLRMYR